MANLHDVSAGPIGTQSAEPLAPLLDLPGVTAAVAATRDSIDRLLAHRALRRQSAAVTAESALRGARASAALDGVDIPLGTLRAGGSSDPIVQGALRAGLAVGGLVDTWRRAPLQALARLHVLAAAGLCPGSALGRPSGGPEVSARLEALGRLVAGGSRAPAVVLAAVVHGELLALRPFGSADGVVARAAARLTMVSHGLDRKLVSVPEVGHVDAGAEYADTLSAYSGGTAAGVARWLHHCCTAVAFGAQEGLAICEAVLRG